MAFGIRLRDAAGAVIWDTSTVAGGIVADVFDVAASTTMTKTYPDFAGSTCRVFCPAYLQIEPSTVDTALGYPRVNVGSGFARQLIVTMA
jgi:hypothetical protein